MGIARKFLLVILSSIFTALLFATAFDTGIVRIVTHPATVKKIVADSGVYTDIIPNLLKQAGSVSSQTGNVPLVNSQVQSAAQTTFSPQFLQTTTNTIIDSIYQWLDGKTATPNFRIDLRTQKNQFANLVAQAAAQKAASLPACTQAVDMASYNVFDASCLPDGVTPSDVSGGTMNTLLNGQGFLDQPVITASNLKTSGSNQNVFDNQLKKAPSDYRWAKKVPIILGLLTVLVGAAIVFLYADRLRGLRHLGITLLVVGVFMLIFAWALNFGVNKGTTHLNLNNAAFEKDIKMLITDLIQSIDKNYWFFGGLYAVLGAAAIGAPIYLRRSQPVAATPAETPEPAKKTPKTPPVSKK